MMYRILKDGEVYCYTEYVEFLNAKDGFYVPAMNQPTATGAIVNGLTYALIGFEDQYPGCEAVAVENINGGEKIHEVDVVTQETDETAVDHEFRLTCLELGTTAEEASTLMV